MWKSRIKARGLSWGYTFGSINILTAFKIKRPE